MRRLEVLDDLENEYIFFVVEDMNTKMIIGVGTITIINKSSNLVQVGYIENIMIQRDYQNIGLGNIVLRQLENYCLEVKKCIKVIVNCVV